MKTTAKILTIPIIMMLAAATAGGQIRSNPTDAVVPPGDEPGDDLNLFFVPPAADDPTAPPGASGPVVTGIIDDVFPRDGALRVRVEQVGYRPVVLRGMNTAVIMRNSGKIVSVDEMQRGMDVTVFLNRKGRRWNVSKVIIPDERAPSPPR